MKMSLRAGLATLPVVLVATTSISCSGSENRAYARSTEVVRGVTIVDPADEPYTPAPVRAAGSLTGQVHFAGEAPEDSSVTVTRDERVCGNTLKQITLQTAGDRVAGALVWIADIRRGRALPLQRRHELVQTRCTYGPLAQFAIAGGALNVRTEDPILSETIVIDMRTLDTLAVLPFNSSGSLVPLDAQLRRPAMLKITSPTHPWMEAWVAVVDHPYFAMTDREGSFRIEGIPPGSYQLKAWHPRFGLTSGTVTVQSGIAADVELRFGTSPAPEALRTEQAQLSLQRAAGSAQP